MYQRSRILRRKLLNYTKHTGNYSGSHRKGLVIECKSFSVMVPGIPSLEHETRTKILPQHIIIISPNEKIWQLKLQKLKYLRQKLLLSQLKKGISKPIDWFSSLDRIKFEISFRIDNKL